MKGCVSQDVLRELLADEHCADQCAEGDETSDECNPERGNSCKFKIEEGIWRPLLPPDEQRAADERDRKQNRNGDRDSLGKHDDSEHKAGDHDHAEASACVVNGCLLRSPTAREDDRAHDEHEESERHRDEEYRTPPVVVEEVPTHDRPEH